MHSRTRQVEEKKAQTIEEKDADLKDIKLLVVDDDTDALEMLKTVLSAHGANVTTASSAIEALKIIEGNLPDVLVSDIGMPEMNGMELIGKIREAKSKKLRAIPAIAVTAYASAEDRERILASGFNQYQHKPVNFTDLVKNIKNAAKK
jgi:CheY-like chemotaxis protein